MEHPDKALADSLGALLGSGAVEGLERLSGGANMETWSFDWIAPGAPPEALILRRLPAGVAAAPEGDLLPRELAVEAALLRQAGAAGVPVPAVRRELTPADDLGEGYLMTRLGGEALPARLFRDPAFAPGLARLAADCGRALAAIHAMPVAPLPRGLPRAGHGERLAQLQSFLVDFGDPSPVLQLALGWLREHAPPERPACLVHGDFRAGNLLVDGTGLVAVLDWERAHLGQPAEDLGYLCAQVWRFGRPQLPVGGFGDYQELLDAYRAAAGWAPGRAELHYWELFAALDWGLVCLTMRELYRSGRDRSLERAAVGRRLSEAEMDLLLLIEEGA
jgi:aminoglycoside phosphotransferase (APT) family kinase protein